MKSKSFDLGQPSVEKAKQNRTFDFVNLYKSAAETSVSLNEKRKISEHHEKESIMVKSESPKREKSPNKRKKKEKRESVDISQIDIEGPVLNSSVGSSTPLNEFKVTSTPFNKRRTHAKNNKVKSIMKNSSVLTDDAMDSSKLDHSTTNPKKRNKSVSFMLDDSEEVVIKKTKSEDSISATHDVTPSKLKSYKVKKHIKKVKKDQDEKENKIDVNKQTVNVDSSTKDVKKVDKMKNSSTDAESTGDSQNANKKKRKKTKKVKKPDMSEPKDNTTTESTTELVAEKIKKPKKKKYQEKQTDTEDEPASKSRKKEIKPDVIAEDLENLSIGDNAHTLTNLLDEMTVVDKEKRKKLRQKLKNKKSKGAREIDSEKTEETEEKVKKWKRRKWNKDTKVETKDESLQTMVIVENLPLSMLFSYKKILAEHFVKCGLIRNVGIAEVYTTEISEPAFTSTVQFYSDGAATQALQEDKTTFSGSIIRVKRPLPPTQTTLVVRSYGGLTGQAVSAAFSTAGRIRNMRHLIKGKHAMATVFIEFDGPESVERAIQLATNIKIGGKKIYASKYEVRPKKKPEKPSEGSDADQSDDSQN